MYDTYAVFKNLICCLIECSVPVKYLTETGTYDNTALFVESRVVNKPTSRFVINLRGVPNKGLGTGRLASEIMGMNNVITEIEYDNKIYSVEIMVDEFQPDGVDDKKRLSYSSTVKLALYRKEDIDG